MIINISRPQTKTPQRVFSFTLLIIICSFFKTPDFSAYLKQTTLKSTKRRDL